jgi:hypothetical protein
MKYLLFALLIGATKLSAQGPAIIPAAPFHPQETIKNIPTPKPVQMSAGAPKIISDSITLPPVKPTLVVRQTSKRS